jgi:hypothetical protein
LLCGDIPFVSYGDILHRQVSYFKREFTLLIRRAAMYTTDWFMFIVSLAMSGWAGLCTYLSIRLKAIGFTALFGFLTVVCLLMAVWCIIPE